MVAHSDAVVVGTIIRKMGTKRSPNGYSTDYDYVFKDYELEVEQSIFPSGLPQRIAILTEAGIASNDSNLQVSRAVKGPEFEAGERVMVFLERVRSEVLEACGRTAVHVRRSPSRRLRGQGANNIERLNDTPDDAAFITKGGVNYFILLAKVYGLIGG